MATIYSLCCFGGRTGNTVTFTDAGDVVNLTNHGLRDGTGVVFSSTGTLPTGVTAGTTYYSKSTGNDTFTIYTTSGLVTQVTFTGTGSGTHTVKSAYFLSLTSDQKARYGTAGAERIYNGVAAWKTARGSATTGFDVEVLEVGMAWDDVSLGASATIQITGAPRTIITSTINGVRTGAFHGGVVGAGYAIRSYNAQTGNFVTIDGITFRPQYVTSSVDLLDVTGLNCSITRNIFYGYNVTKSVGISVNSSGSAGDVQYNLFLNLLNGIINYGGDQSKIANNIVVKCGTGIYPSGNATTFRYGYWYNNISVGNTTNWGVEPTSLNGATNNYGLVTDTPWAIGAGTVGVIATTDFADYANNNFFPAAATSPQVETGLEFYGALGYDVADNAVPRYLGTTENTVVNAGSFVVGYRYVIASVGTTNFTTIGASANTVGVSFKATGVGSGTGTATCTPTRDVGCYEYDFGQGTKPNTVTVAGSGIVDGTRIKIAKQSDGTELRNVVLSGATSDSYSQNTPADTPVYIYARKSSAAPYYKPVKLSATITYANGLSYSLSGLQIEDIARGTYAAGVATDWTINTSTGAITHTSGTTRYTVQDLYSFYQDFMDDSATVDDAPLMDGITPTIFKMIGSGAITESDMEDLKGGSIELLNGTLYSNVYSVGTISGTPNVYIYQGSTKLTQHWAAGHIDILVKVKNAGTLISSGLVTGYARKWGYTYDHYEADLSAGGRSVMPLATADDANITQTESTVAVWTDVTHSFSTYSLDFGDGAGNKTYYCRIDCGNRPLAEVYQRCQYVTREGAGTLNGIPGDRYQAAHSSMTPVKTAPFGVYSGGVWSVAPGVWLDNVPASEATNYILTDAAGGTHQNVVTPGAITATVLANTRVRVYNVTKAAEIDNVLVTGTSYSYTITTEAEQNDVIKFYACKLGYQEFVSTGIFDAAAGLTVLVSQDIDPIYAAWGIDGSTVTEFTLDITGMIEIDANDIDGSTLKTRLGAWYNYILTTADGIRHLFGAMTFLSTAAIRINVNVIDLKIENTNASTPLRFTDLDVRLYRSDGSSLIATTSYSIHNDYSGVPDVVETGVSGLTTAESNQLFGLPDGPAIASAVWGKTLP